MPMRTPRDWEELERELHAAGVSAEEIEAGARELLALARGAQLADARKQMGLTQKDIAAELGASHSLSRPGYRRPASRESAARNAARTASAGSRNRVLAARLPTLDVLLDATGAS